MWSGSGSKDWKFVHGHTKCEVYVGYPSGDVEDVIEYEFEAQKRGTG